MGRWEVAPDPGAACGQSENIVVATDRDRERTRPEHGLMRVTDVGSTDHREDEWRVAERQVRLDEPSTCREKHGEAGQTARADLPDSRDDQLLLAPRSGVVAVRMAGPGERERPKVHQVMPPARKAEATVAAPKAYSSTKSQPMIQANISPSVA